MTDDWLDRLTTVHRLPGTFRKAMRYARRHDPKPPQSPERNRIVPPKMTWEETRDWLKAKGEVADWPWLQKLIAPRVRDVGFGPWRRK